MAKTATRNKPQLFYMKNVFLLLAMIILGSSVPAQEMDSTQLALDKMAAKKTVEQFLTAAGDYDTETISTLFMPKANISGTAWKNESWSSYTMTIQEFIDLLKANPSPKKYREPVDNWTIHLEQGQLAFVRADARVVRDGIPQRHNIDYFTLVKENGNWKILNGSYVSRPVE